MASKVTKLGAIDVEVTNGDQVTGIWTLGVDSGSARQQTGKRAAVAGLIPGLHEIGVSGDVGGTLRSAQQTVQVPEGAVESVSLTLA